MFSADFVICRLLTTEERLEMERSTNPKGPDDRKEEQGRRFPEWRASKGQIRERRIITKRELKVQCYDQRWRDAG